MIGNKGALANQGVKSPSQRLRGLTVVTIRDIRHVKQGRFGQTDMAFLDGSPILHDLGPQAPDG